METTAFEEALSYIYQIYAKFINFVFDDMEMFENVTFGWVIFACSVMVILISNVLNVPVKNRLYLHRDDFKSKKDSDK